MDFGESVSDVICDEYILYSSEFGCRVMPDTHVLKKFGTIFRHVGDRHRLCGMS